MLSSREMVLRVLVDSLNATLPRGGHCMRYFSILTISLVCAFGLAANAQEQSKQKTKIKGGTAQTVSYTGCVATGAQTTTYLLNNSVPVTKTVEQKGTTGTVTTTTKSYAL